MLVYVHRYLPSGRDSTGRLISRGRLGSPAGTCTGGLNRQVGVVGRLRGRDCTPAETVGLRVSRGLTGSGPPKSQGGTGRTGTWRLRRWTPYDGDHELVCPGLSHVAPVPDWGVEVGTEVETRGEVSGRKEPSPGSQTPLSTLETRGGGGVTLS